ncbi:MAG: hypothetical protein Roseis2KO_06250 [Roseivirga sp.]
MKKIWLLFFICVSGVLQAQSRVTIGWLPEVSVSHRWAEQWRLTGQLESMQRGWETDGKGELRGDYRYIRTDATLALSYRLGPSWSVAVGNMARLQGRDFVYRTLQQISYSRRGQFRLAHRFRTDQTFVSNQATRYRFRYRFSIEVPLKGQSLNDGEWYLISSVEQIAQLQGAGWQWEQRQATALGYYINGKNKVEVGFDYRLDDFIETRGRHRIWTTLNYFVNL